MCIRVCVYTGGGIYDLLDSSGRPIREGMVSPKQSSGNGEGAARRVAVVFAAGQIDTARIQVRATVCVYVCACALVCARVRTLV